MWSRTFLKEEAKTTLAACHGLSILICLLLSAIVSIGNLFSRKYNITYNINTGTWHQVRQYGLLARIPFSFLIPILLKIFLTNPLQIGCQHFFLSCRVRPADFNAVGFSLQKEHYGNACRVMFLRNLFISLWSLLFIIPGIYKTYQYRMVPYLLAESPQMDYQQALSLSAAMMDGEKWNAFILDLSFFGWYFLSAFTCMILAVVYVIPYRNHTNAGLYIILREKAIINGLVNPAELYAVVNPES